MFLIGKLNSNKFEIYKLKWESKHEFSFTGIFNSRWLEITFMRDVVHKCTEALFIPNQKVSSKILINLYSFDDELNKSEILKFVKNGRFILMFMHECFHFVQSMCYDPNELKNTNVKDEDRMKSPIELEAYIFMIVEFSQTVLKKLIKNYDDLIECLENFYNEDPYFMSCARQMILDNKEETLDILEQNRDYLKLDVKQRDKQLAEQRLFVSNLIDEGKLKPRITNNQICYNSKIASDSPLKSKIFNRCYEIDFDEK